MIVTLDIPDWSARKVRDAVVSCLVHEARDEVLEAARTEAEQAMTAYIQKRAESIVDDLLEEEWCPVDEFGRPKGDSQTLKAWAVDYFRSWLEVTVGPDGKPSTSHYGSSRQRRIRWYAQQAVSYQAMKGIREGIDSAVSEVKEQVKTESTRLLAEALDKLLRGR